MPWHQLSSIEEIEKVKRASFLKPQCIFKHSTRCSISHTAHRRLEQHLSEIEKVSDVYFLDLIRFREISNHIADVFSVHHESPQVLIIRQGECTFDESHLGIRPDEIIQQCLTA